MKYFATCLLFSAFLCGQTPTTPPPSPVAPGTPAPPAQAALPQAAPAAPITPDTVVAEVGDKKYTASDVDKLFASLPQQLQAQARMQPDKTLMTILMIRYLAEEAEKQNIDKRPPWNSTIEFQRMQILMQAEINDYKDKIQISAEDQEKNYKENPDRFKEVKVKVIHVSFSATPDKPGPDGKKMLSEAEAKAKIDELRKQIVAGEDFGKLARDNSDHKESATKDGDFGTIKHNSPYPEPVKTAVFALKEGEVSEPVKQANGFYLIRADSVVVLPFNEVRPQIIEDLKQARFNDWMKSIQNRFAVKVDNPAYFVPRRPAQLQTVR
jgi:peptidyl-prolyl cis-trans isomerase C